MLMINGHAKYSPDGREAPAYIVEIPDFDFMTQAETLDVCLDMAKDAVALMFEDTGVSQDFEIRWQTKGAKEVRLSHRGDSNCPF
jgi:predicted RNase H-like HicB family nuclease